jgi:D-alanyl-D-alanine carboxypeptidase/D-alanyl-D-alanine-endopeptidase (penicillin-binding protein 4)
MSSPATRTAVAVRVAVALAVAVAVGCRGSAAETADAAASASAALSAASAKSAPAVASVPLANGSTPAPTGELTSPVANANPALKEAVTTLTHKISEYGGHLGVAILDVQTGELLAAQNDRRPLNPASNAKLFTAAAALSQLHGNYRFETGLYGEAKGNAVTKLVLRGQGDPSLVTRDLWEMVQELKEKGIRRVEGDILVDQHFFDESFVPPAFEQQPNEWATFRAPVSALALNENTVTMTVRPTTADAPAIVTFDPPGFVDVDGTVKTASDGHPESVRLELASNGFRLAAKIGGAVAEKDRPMSFTRRVDNPTLLAGYALRALLVASGIAVAGDVKPGGEAVKTLLAMHQSRPLSSLLYELGKQSDNFYAEMVIKTLGAEKQARPGRSADGAEIVARYLQGIGALEDGTVIKNGSGLYDANRVSALGTVKLLRAAYRDQAISTEYIAQLAVGGVDGTLHKRFRELHDKRVLRAKTGTLEATVALSGYVLAPPGKSAVAFAILVNDVAGKVSGARAAVDACVDVIVRQLWRADAKRSDSAAR